MAFLVKVGKEASREHSLKTGGKSSQRQKKGLQGIVMPYLDISTPQRKQLALYQTHPQKSQSPKKLLLITLWLH